MRITCLLLTSLQTHSSQVPLAPNKQVFFFPPQLTTIRWCSSATDSLEKKHKTPGFAALINSLRAWILEKPCAHICAHHMAFDL